MLDYHYHSMKDSERKIFRIIPKLKMKLKLRRKSNDFSNIIPNDFLTSLQIEMQRQIAKDIIEKSKEINKWQREISEGVVVMERVDCSPEFIGKWMNSKMEIVNALQKEIECAQQRGQIFNELIMSKC